MTKLKAYITIAISVIYHIVALYAIMHLLNLHMFVTGIAAVVWGVTIPVTAWIAALRVGPAVAIIFAESSKEGN